MNHAVPFPWIDELSDSGRLGSVDPEEAKKKGRRLAPLLNRRTRSAAVGTLAFRHLAVGLVAFLIFLLQLSV